MDTILMVTMILLTPFMGMWAFILSECHAADPSPEDNLDLRIDTQMHQAVQDCSLTPEQEAFAALNRIWDSLLSSKGESLEIRGDAHQPASLRTAENYRCVEP